MFGFGFIYIVLAYIDLLYADRFAIARRTRFGQSLSEYLKRAVSREKTDSRTLTHLYTHTHR